MRDDQHRAVVDSEGREKKKKRRERERGTGEEKGMDDDAWMMRRRRRWRKKMIPSAVFVALQMDIGGGGADAATVTRPRDGGA